MFILTFSIFYYNFWPNFTNFSLAFTFFLHSSGTLFYLIHELPVNTLPCTLSVLYLSFRATVNFATQVLVFLFSTSYSFLVICLSAIFSTL